MAKIIICAMLLFSGNDEMRRIMDLRGTWQFELGDKKGWEAADFDDSDWQEIFVPARWEDEGFPGYDGYAWYRKHFHFEETKLPEIVYVNLGRIDDVDEAYLNGKLIGRSGGFPPDFETAYNLERIYPVPIEYFKTGGENVIAVRVYDEYQIGGIESGRIGIFESTSPLDVNLAGAWRFETGDDEEWQAQDYNDRDWSVLFVPGKWENQGFNDYDGHAWYRRTFKVPQKLRDEDLYLILGKIDDVDAAFINGEHVGHTGKMRRSWRRRDDQVYAEMRVYRIPSELLKFGGENTIAVHVFDWGGFGGIWEGPVGIATHENYRKLRRQWRHGSFWDLFN